MRWSWLAVMVGCSGTPVEAEAPGDTAAAPAEVSVALNWYPEPEFAGIYQADIDGTYAAAGLKVDIQGGGPGSPVISQVATGRVAFGVSTADEVVLAKSQGADVLAVFATYQTHPACILVWEARGLNGLQDLTGGTLAMEDGIPFAQWLKKKFAFTGVTQVPYGGGIQSLLLDQNYAQQAYVTSEAVLAKKQNIATECFMVSETGYNPYANVMITSSKFAKEHPDQVHAFVDATAKGWDAYVYGDPTAANQKISSLNPALDVAVLGEMAAAQKPLIVQGIAETETIGLMEESRWVELIGQLNEIGAITGNPPVPSDVYTNEFLQYRRSK